MKFASDDDGDDDDDDDADGVDRVVTPIISEAWASPALSASRDHALNSLTHNLESVEY